MEVVDLELGRMVNLGRGLCHSCKYRLFEEEL